MKDANVHDDDLLVIDKSLNYREDALAVCFLNGEFTLKKVQVEKDKIILMPANPDYDPIVVHEDSDFLLWGYVTYIIKQVY